MYAALARWRWNTDDLASPFWTGPTGAIAALDLRSLPAQAIAGGLGGWGLFGFATDPSLIPGVVVLGDDPQQVLGPLRRNAFQTALGGMTLDAPRLGGAIWEAITRKADPSGAARLKPIIPELHNRATVHFGDFTRQVAFDLADPDHGAVALAVLREDYRRIRAEGGPYRKFLGSLIRKYRTGNYRQFQPGDLPDEEPQAPTTTITDNFDRANADALGTSSEGWSWTEVQNDIDILSNRARLITQAFCVARADSALSSDDHYAQAQIPTLTAIAGANSGAMVRKDATATLTFYYARAQEETATDGWATRKDVAGTITAIGVQTNVDIVVNDTIKVEADGSSILRYRNGTVQDTVTDTAITGNLYTGIIGFPPGAGSDLDNFEAADLAAAGGAGRLALMGVGR